MPPCGQPLATDPSRVCCVSVADIFTFPSMELIHDRVASPSLWCLAASIMMMCAVPSKAASMC